MQELRKQYNEICLEADSHQNAMENLRERLDEMIASLEGLVGSCRFVKEKIDAGHGGFADCTLPVRVGSPGADE